MTISGGIDKEDGVCVCVRVCIYIKKYSSAIKRNKTVPFADMWMDLENVTQSKVNQKEKIHIILLICGI